MAKKEGKNRTVIERRVWPRSGLCKDLNLEFFAKNQLNEKPYFKVENISPFGMNLISNVDMEKETDFDCVITYPGQEKRENLKFRIINEKLIKEKLHSYGVRFLSIPQKAAELLKKTGFPDKAIELKDFTEPD
jgi:hypothetical protein